MRTLALCLAVAVVVLVVVSEAEGRRRRWFQRDSRRHRERGRRDWGHSNAWDRILQNFRKNRFGGRHSFNFGNPGFGFDFDFGWGFGQKEKSWWEGPNVCQSEKADNSTSEENDDAAVDVIHNFKTVSQVCEEGDTAYRCTTTLKTSDGIITKMEIQECCHGYTRKPGDFGCPQELVLTNLAETAESLGLNDLLRAVETADLSEELARGTFTVFAPKDGSFSVDSGVLPVGTGITLQDNPNTVVVSEPLLEKMENQLQTVLLGHLLPEQRRASSFRDEEILETGSPYDSTIRINFYSRPEKLTTANCVPVTSTDNMASNGVIHVVDKVLPTVTSSLMELIQRDKEFSILKTALARANLVSTLQKEGQFTLFAPTNAAFNSLDRKLLDRLLNGNPECLEKVLKQHLLPHVICTAVVEGKAKSRNLLGRYVNLTRTDDAKLFADDAQVVRADVMGTNGVMHFIDAVMIPEDALDLVNGAEERGLTDLVEMVKKAKLVEALQDAENVTLFAPINQAFQSLSTETARALTSDPALLTSVLQYHVVPEELTCRHLGNNMLLDTLNPQAKLRVNEYYSFPFGSRRVLTVQCAPVLVKNLPACNGITHVVNRVLVPPSGNVVDVLAADPDYSTLVRLVKIAGLADSLQAQGPFTVFAPNNQAFEQLGKEAMRDLESDVERLEQILKTHIYQDQLCCAGVFAAPWWRQQRVKSLSGEPVFLSRGHRSDRITVNDAYIHTCDNVATNGVVHGIDEVLMPRPPQPWHMFP